MMSKTAPAKPATAPPSLNEIQRKMALWYTLSPEQRRVIRQSSNRAWEKSKLVWQNERNQHVHDILALSLLRSNSRSPEAGELAAAEQESVLLTECRHLGVFAFEDMPDVQSILANAWKYRHWVFFERLGSWCDEHFGAKFTNRKSIAKRRSARKTPDDHGRKLVFRLWLIRGWARGACFLSWSELIYLFAHHYSEVAKKTVTIVDLEGIGITENWVETWVLQKSGLLRSVQTRSRRRVAK